MIAKFAKATGTKQERVRHALDRLAAQSAHDDELRHLESLPRIPAGKETVLAISDMHKPFSHPDTDDFLDAVAQKYAPTRIVCLGDELDEHAISQHVKDMDAMGADDEISLGIHEMESIYELFPKVDVCLSNHGSRPFRQAAQIGLPSKFLRTYKEFMQAPAGWNWEAKFRIDDWVYEHGEAVGGKHVALNYVEAEMCNVAFGHTHTAAGIQYALRNSRMVIGMACSCLIDPVRYAFAYAKKNARRAMLGTGVVVRNVPCYVPLLTNNRGRWIRKLAF